ELALVSGKPGHVRHAGHLSQHLAFDPATAKHSGTGKLSHHLSHLYILFDELIDLCDRRSRSACDATPAIRVQYSMIVALFPRHRIDDGFSALQLLLHHLRLLVVQLWHADAAEQLVWQKLQNL